MRNDWPTPAAAIARYQPAPLASERGKYLTRGDAGTELLATRDAGAYAEWVCSAPLVRAALGQPEGQPTRGELRGLVLRGGRGSSGLPADNPWRLPPMAEPDQLVRELWAPAASYLPAFLDRLARSVFAVAMVRFDQQEYLVYLMAAWVSRDVPDVAAASIEDLMDARELTVGEAWGTRPLPDSVEETVPVLGSAMPAPLRAVAAVHGSLTIYYDNVYLDLARLESYREFLGEPGGDFGVPDGRYVAFAGHHECWYLMDLDTRDQLGDPTVVSFDPNDMLVLSSRRPLRTFLAESLADMLDIDS